MGSLSHKLRSGLLEFSTDVGLRYAKPSFVDRMYLLWTFRNFRRLPEQVLNPRQRQLIDKLIHTPTLRGRGAAATSPIIGTVEIVHAVRDRKREAALNPGKLVEIDKAGAQMDMPRAVGSEGISLPFSQQTKSRTVTAPSGPRTIDAKAPTPHSVERSHLEKASRMPVKPGVSRTRARQSWKWGIGAAFAAVLFGGLFYFDQPTPSVILPQVEEASTRSRPPVADSIAEQPEAAPPERLSKPSAAHPVGQLQAPAIPIRAAAPTAAPVLTASSAAVQPPPPAESSASATPVARNVSTNSSQLSPTSGEPVGHLPAITSSQADSLPANPGIAREVVPAATNPPPPDRVVIAAAPQSFDYPVAPNPTLTGKVSLKVIIGAGGDVQEVRVIGGNRVLADAAVRAIRRWRYRPAKLNGHPAEAETNVTINFAGDDAVTIAFR